MPDSNQNPNNNPDKKNNNNKKKRSGGQMVMMLLIASLVMLLFSGIFTNSNGLASGSEEISYTEFLEMVEAGEVYSVQIQSYQINITTTEAQQTAVAAAESIAEQAGTTIDEDEIEADASYYTARVDDEELISILKTYDVEISGKIPDNTADIIYSLLTLVLPLVLLCALFIYMMRRAGGSGGIMGVGKSNAKVYVQKETGVTFKDVAGQDEAKESLQEVVDFLHNPMKYVEIGAKLPKGALLVGPPGTGKTLLAKAVAGEAHVPFFSLAGSDFVEMFVGVGASRVRDLFKEAQKNAPCIIFIDEIDAIGKSRDTRYGGNDEREQTLNQLLAEMDGFDTSKGLLILAATNRPEVLDKALLRPGRFDRRIIVDKPDLKGRIDTLKVHSKDVRMDESVDLEEIALATSGAVGSDLANIINEAAINAVKQGRNVVQQQDLFESVEVVIAGKEKKDRILGDEEKKIVAYHEVGHALIAAIKKNSEPIQKITIVPRTMGALGYVMQTPEEEKYLMTQDELKTRLVTYMGGRAAESIFFDSVTTGASNDIENATKIARAMVTQYGMSDEFGMVALESVENRYLDGRPVMNCGDQTAARVDAEIQRIMRESFDEAVEILSENKEIVEEIGGYLYEQETITGKKFMEIYCRLKGIPEPEEEKKPSVGINYTVDDTTRLNGEDEGPAKHISMGPFTLENSTEQTSETQETVAVQEAEDDSDIVESDGAIEYHRQQEEQSDID